MSRVLLFLQALIIIGALAGIVQPRTPYRLTQLLLVSEGNTKTQMLAPDQRTFLKVAFTIFGIALL